MWDSAMVAVLFVMLLFPEIMGANPSPEIPRLELTIQRVFPKEDSSDHEESYIWKGSDIESIQTGESMSR
jgi:hypothetical protein